MGFFIFFFYQRNTNRHLYCEFTQHFHTNYIFFFKNHKNEIFANLNSRDEQLHGKSQDLYY